MWNWDIGLAVGGFFVQCSLAALGLTLGHWKNKAGFFLLVLFGAAFTGIAVKRGVEASGRVENRLATIEGQNRILQTQNSKLQGQMNSFQSLTEAELRSYHAAIGAVFTANVLYGPEHQRRESILQTLRREYILSHDDVSPGLLAGTEWPPLDWINQRLKELKEPWAVEQMEPDITFRKLR